MALGTGTLAAAQGAAPLRASFAQRLSFAGDGAYPTGGTLNFGDTYMTALLGGTPTILDAWGYGTTAGAITHVVRYVASTDALQVFVLATGAEVASAASLAAVTFDIVVMYA